ncbi:hypothetical protein [Corynebacterium auriscanis]|uniref:hypothetical protein n=1 Tax=Corynebacterium auriscanis TaxID=99807 RepID=UPI003CF2AE12
MTTETLSTRLRFLIDHVYPRGGKPQTFEQVSRGMKAYGFHVSPQDLETACNSQSSDVPSELVQAIAVYYRISPRSLTNDDEWEQLRDWLLEARTALDSSNIRVARSWAALTKRRGLPFFKK